MKKAIRILGIVAAVLLGLAALLYFGGLIGQLLESYTAWEKAGGMAGQAQIRVAQPWSLRIVCVPPLPIPG